MDLPKSIVKEFAKQAIEKKPTVDKPTQLVGTVHVEDGQTFVYLDGSNGSKTPVSETVAYQSGDRVLVSIQNRKATIIGNYTDPSINQALDDVIVEYALSSSSVSFIAWPGEKGEWNTIAPEKEDGSYMWQRTTKISTNPLINPEISLTCIQGSDGETGADGYSPTVTTGTSSDGSTTVTVTNKDGSTTTVLVDGTARTGVDSLNDTVFGVQTFEYILDGVTIPAYKREDGTYYYILNDEEVTVAEADLVHDADGELTSYQEGGIYEDLEIITGDIDAIDTKVDGFNARETAIYNAISDNSLIARKNARVEENSVIITNDTTTEELLNYLQLNVDSIMIYGDGDSIVTIAKAEGNSGYMEMAGTSLFIAQESRLSTIRLRSADRIGNLAFVAGSNGHVSLKEVLD